MSKIYLDNAATTRVRDEVVDSITKVIKNEYGNPTNAERCKASCNRHFQGSDFEVGLDDYWILMFVHSGSVGRLIH